MEITADFEFHPVGQGCFYTGCIKLHKPVSASFNFVYDCGTLSKIYYLEDEVDRYRNEIGVNSIDLLIISHFDDDHVNGVVRLLDGKHCKKLVIPYYEPIERLILFLCSKSGDNDYHLLLLNPINFFSSNRFNIDEIVLIGGPDINENQEDINPKPIIEKPTDEDSIEYVTLELDTDYMSGAERTKLIEEINKLENKRIYESKLQFLNKPYRLSNSIWEFVFYLKKHEDKIIKEFTADLNNLLTENKIELKDIFEENNLKKIKGYYLNRYKNKDLNNTSLVTFHQPLINKRWIRFFVYGRGYISNFKNCILQKLGTLLTGDINISSQLSKNKLLSYFNTYINEVGVFQIPHHGAKSSWPFKLINGLDVFCKYVINHGLRRPHPSVEVVDSILHISKENRLHLNNEVCNFKYGFQIHYKK